MKRTIVIILVIIWGRIGLGQATTTPIRWMVNFPVIDWPQNFNKKNPVPSMQQSLDWSAGMYDLSFWGLQSGMNRLINPTSHPVINKTSSYAAGLMFSKYGSELPVPLGVWGHEEFHRSVLSTYDVTSYNGNWLFERWDGTVFGPSDADLAQLKQDHLEGLLYSYVSGVQYETLLTKDQVMADFYSERTQYKSPLYLYNAWYVYNYFRFATSTHSDSVKVIAPDYESAVDTERDFAGADLNAWAYDMFLPNESFYNRDDFPYGSSENRRVGFHDLPEEAQQYLVRQKRLALLNFLNPSIILIPRISIGDKLDIMPFMQYNPTHFGNAISLIMPFSYSGQGYLLGVHQYGNQHVKGYGVEMGVQQLNYQQLSLSITWKIFKQPYSFDDRETHWGTQGKVQLGYALNDAFQLCLTTSVKSNGWVEGSPYLDRKIQSQLGIQYRLYAPTLKL